VKVYFTRVSISRSHIFGQGSAVCSQISSKALCELYRNSPCLGAGNIMEMTRSYPSQRHRSAITGCCDRACAADFKTASLCSRLFTGAHNVAIFGPVKSSTVHGCSLTFTGVGVRIGVKQV
jgi:hypothetical protein